MCAIVEFISRQPGGPKRLLAAYVPDEHGRCRGCTIPGTGTPFEPWPCKIHYYAASAADAVGRVRDVTH